MIGKTTATALAAFLAVLVATSAAWPRGRGFDDYHKGGFVKACSLVGVNPAYHPDIFGDPVFARARYGFVMARDGSWHVIPGCNIP